MGKRKYVDADLGDIEVKVKKVTMRAKSGMFPPFACFVALRSMARCLPWWGKRLSLSRLTPRLLLSMSHESNIILPNLHAILSTLHSPHFTDYRIT